MSDTGLDFQLGEMADTIRETTERFARDRIAPIAAEIDETDEFPQQQTIEELEEFHQAAPPCQPQPVSCKTAATTMTMMREMGRNTFQPIRISWS